MSYLLDRLTFFNRVVGDFADGHGVVTREDWRIAAEVQCA
jgi:nitrate reductase alpha subunit